MPARVPHTGSFRKTIFVFWCILIRDQIWRVNGFPVLRRTKVFRLKSRLASSSFGLPVEKPFLVKAVLACGFADSELSHLKDIVLQSSSALNLSCSVEDLQPRRRAVSVNIHGPTGRILVLACSSNLDDERLGNLNERIASLIDEDLYSPSPNLSDPFLVRFEEEEDISDNYNLASVIEQAVDEGQLLVPLNQFSHSKQPNDIDFIPSIRVEVDGAFVKEPGRDEPVWDTSSLLVFDDLISSDLRKRLAQTLNGGKDLRENEAPNPERWERGGLLDRLDDEPSCASYGLKPETIRDLCFEQHEAIQEMEKKITKLFSGFIVSRLPEAVFGQSVSPLTANAPVTGDSFSYHIDGDPNMAPPSLWTDIYGRYPNRSRGKPRYMSFLVYLNDEWKEEWGAPTRFLDVATGTEYNVNPRPGRCVCMDQDVTHSVTAPFASAKIRPRYSLVWKLILHPRQIGQDMRELSGGRSWPKPKLIGSAKQSDA